MIAAISRASTRMSGSPSSSLMTTPSGRGRGCPRPASAIASSEETTSDARYGRRKPRRRTNVRQPCRGVLRGPRRARLRRVRIVLEAVPNVSEGRSPAASPRSELRSRERRCCSTCTPIPTTTAPYSRSPAAREELLDALVAGIAAAVELADLREHVGVHPRVGAADVVPLVPLAPRTSRTLRTRHELSRRASDPSSVFRSSSTASWAPGGRPAFFRRGGLDELRRRVDVGRARAGAMDPVESIRARAPSSSEPAMRSSRTTSSSRPTTSRSHVRSHGQCASRAAAWPACRRSAFGSRARGASR